MKNTSIRQKPSSDRMGAMTAGIFFLVAMFSSLVGGLMIESYTIPDFLTSIYGHGGMVKLGVYLELVNGISVIGIVACIYPFLKRYNERLALGYAGLRIIEALACIAAAAVPMIYLSMSEAYQQTGFSSATDIRMMGELLIGLRSSITGLLVPIFFAGGALVFYAMLYISKLVPRFLSAWGFIAAIPVIILNTIDISTELQMVLAFPIILNEITLGIYQIVKGVRTITPIAVKG